MPLLLLQPTACATAAAAAAVPAPSAAFSRPPPSSRLRCSHLPFAFPRLRKYGRRHREPVAAAPTSDDDEEDEEETQAEDGDYDEDDVEMEVDEEEFLATRPKPMGFGEGKTYATDVEEQLLREMGLGGAPRGGDAASAKRGEGNSSAKETGADLNDKGVQVRLWNLPKKKNIHKDLKQAFKGFPGLLSIDPAVSANKKTRDPICKGFAYLKLESADAATSAWSYLNFISQITPIIASPQHFLTSVPSLASRNHALILKLLPLACMRTFTDSTRFVEIYSRKPVAFGKVEKPISCCIVDGNSSVEPSNKASHATSQPRSKQLSLLVAS